MKTKTACKIIFTITLYRLNLQELFNLVVSGFEDDLKGKSEETN